MLLGRIAAVSLGTRRGAHSACLVGVDGDEMFLSSWGKVHKIKRGIGEIGKLRAAADLISPDRRKDGSLKFFNHLK